MSTRSRSTVVCAECGESYTTLTQTVKRTIKRFGKCVCPDCAKTLGAKKRKEVCLEKYGVDNPMKLKETQDKLHKTHFERYGYETPFSNPDIQKQIRLEYREKTGYDNPAQNPDCKEKAKQTCLERYGYEYAIQCPEIQEQIMHTAYENGTIPTSKPQLECFNILQDMGYDVILNYLVPPLSLDTLIKVGDTLIDFEYDGWFWHQNKQKDCARNQVLIDLGYKIFRVKAFSDIVPSQELLQEGINTLLNTDKKIFYREIGEKRKE